MSEGPVRQKLAAILVADAVGYSRLMAADARGALAALEAARTCFRSAIESNHGRVVDMAGDSVLALFATAAGAISAAMGAHAALSDGTHRLQYRMGVHLGDVIEKPDGTVYGHGVNVAARLQALTEPGGIVISDLVHGALDGKLAARFVEHGSHHVKNIDRPVTAYRLAPLQAKAAEPASGGQQSRRASIAVLPFDNMSGDPGQTHVADGLTEDLIAALSKYRGLSVAARNSSFAYKGRAVDIRQVGQELGVAYVLEGSVRKAGDRLRVIAQLIDGASGEHVWAERFDRELEDLFALQDEMVAVIAGRLEPELTVTEMRRAARKPTSSVGAWDCYYLALSHLYRFTRDSNSEAKALFQRAIELDPRFALAYARLAYSLVLDIVYYDQPATPAQLDEILRLSTTAVALDPQDGFCHLALGRTHIARRDYELGLAACKTGLQFNPSMGAAYCAMGDALAYAGRPEESIGWFEQAVRLSPNDPWRWAFHAYGALAQIFRGDFEQAVQWAQQAILTPNCQYWAHAHLASALGHLGRSAEGAAALARLKELKPQFSLAYAREQLFYLRHEEQLERYLAGLRKAGLEG